MDLLPVIIIAAAFSSLAGLGIYFAVDYLRKRRKAKHSPFGSYDPEQANARREHCDAYSVGTFYW